MATGVTNVGAANIILREASRSARRWQTYALRAAFSGSLLAFVLTAVWALALSGWVDQAAAAGYARNVFVAVGAFQALLAVFFSPLLCARGVIEERRDGTVELLVLTRLTPRQIHLGKLASRLLVTATLILSALPVLAILQSLGGFSATELLASTLNSLMAAVVMGALGAFFAVFTRSPIAAAGAALAWAGSAFIVLPLLYWPLVLGWEAPAHVSPLFGHLSDGPGALLPLVLYGPVAWGAVTLGAEAFALRASGAQLMSYFDRKLWRANARLVLLGVAVAYWTFAFPVAVIGGWATGVATNTGTSALLLRVAAVGGVWVGVALAVWVGTWVYLQVAMDVVMVVDRALSPAGTRVSKRGVRVGSNPVLWREVSPRAWRAVGPAFGVWLLGLYLVAQSGLWMLPGGLLGLGAMQAALAALTGVWVATGSLERERHDGTLPILLLSTMSSWRLVLGKAMGALVPAWLMALIAWPMWLAGRPFFGVLVADRDAGIELVEAAVACVWLLPALAVVVFGSQVVALRIKNPTVALGVNVGWVSALTLVPPILGLFLRPFPVLLAPLAVLQPALVPGASLWHGLVGTALASLVSVGLFAVLVARLRAWGTRDA